MAKHIKHTFWSDKDITDWAVTYTTQGTPIMKLEQQLQVSHSTLWWCFIHRLPRIDDQLYTKVMERIKFNKDNIHRRTSK